jgi:hypothetical protein
MTSYYCDPFWHDGDKTVVAKFLILPTPIDRHLSLNGYASCELHAGPALSVMLEKVKKVTVHVVNSVPPADRV